VISRRSIKGSFGGPLAPRPGSFAAVPRGNDSGNDHGSASSRRAKVQQAGERWGEEAKTALAGAFTELRTERGWSKSETADEMGVGPRQYGLYEAGETLPGLPIIWRFEQALGLPPGRLLVIAGLIADIDPWELSALHEVSRSRVATQRSRGLRSRQPEN
jgi:transcriptional regulator with XRE-family HTH domain